LLANPTPGGRDRNAGDKTHDFNFCPDGEGFYCTLVMRQCVNVVRHDTAIFKINFLIKNNFMDTIMTKTSLDLKFAQIAWVVKDIKAAEIFFRDTMGISNLSKVETIRVKEFEGTYYGKPSNAESLVAIAYSGGTFIELIQPISGNSIFQDYLDKNPAGGIQHIAYSLPVAKLGKVISEFADKGLPVISSFNHPIAKIVFFDTYEEIGVMTEIMGITEEGEKAVQKMKN